MRGAQVHRSVDLGGFDFAERIRHFQPRIPWDQDLKIGIEKSFPGAYGFAICLDHKPVGRRSLGRFRFGFEDCEERGPALRPGLKTNLRGDLSGPRLITVNHLFQAHVHFPVASRSYRNQTIGIRDPDRQGMIEREGDFLRVSMRVAEPLAGPYRYVSDFNGKFSDESGQLAVGGFCYERPDHHHQENADNFSNTYGEGVLLQEIVNQLPQAQQNKQDRPITAGERPKTEADAEIPQKEQNPDTDPEQGSQQRWTMLV